MNLELSCLISGCYAGKQVSKPVSFSKTKPWVPASTSPLVEAIKLKVLFEFSTCKIILRTHR